MPLTLALSDARAGNRRQAVALAETLDAHATASLLQPRAPWGWLAPRRLPGSTHAFGEAFRDTCDAPPDLVVGCGRQAALATRLLRARGARAVQVLDPRIDTRHWDWIVAPAHDGLRGDNVIATLGSLHPVDDLWLARARRDAPALAGLPAPRTLLLVGGPSRHAALDDAAFGALLRQLEATVRTEGGSLLVLASRRTPHAWREAMARPAAGLPGLRWRDARDGENPHAGALAWADRIVCTPDSVNMMSEAAATLVPVFAWAPGALQGRPRAFLDALLQRGRVRALDADLATFAVEPLRETARVAALLRDRLPLSA